MKILNLTDTPIRVLRNPDESDNSYTSYRSYATEYGVHIGAADAEYYEPETNDVDAGDIVMVDNVYILNTKAASIKVRAELPAPQQDTLFIVTQKVAVEYAGVRDDLLFPGIGINVDSNGKNAIIYKYLARVLP